MSQTKVYEAGTKLAEVVHSEGKADPNAPSSSAVVLAPQVEKHLKFGVVEIDGDAAKELMSYGSGTSAKDKSVATAYQAIEEGRQLIDLRSSLIKSWSDRYARGDFLNGVPPIAIARGDLSGELIICRSTSDQNITYGTVTGAFRRPKFSMTFEALRQGKWGSDNMRLIREGRTRAPHIPPYIATRVGDLKNKLLFWEADWVYSERNVVRPRTADPALIEHIAGDLYAVVATWELTALEVAALGG